MLCMYAYIDTQVTVLITGTTSMWGARYVGDGNGGHIIEGQMYVERLTAVDGADRPLPVIFIHGGGQTGTVSGWTL